MENGTQEGMIMREWIDQVQLLEEGQGQQQQGQRKSPQDKMFDAFVSSIVKEFMQFIRQKQQTRVQQQQQAQIPPKPPGFNPQPLPPQPTQQQ
ncbi:MAG: hypothetical protein J5382_09665 [Bacteroidales bacterium]|nr:hypothetical protein [Bacteroidales bacterium]